MADSYKYIPYKGVNPVKRLYEEKFLLEKAYDFLNVLIRGNTLFVTGYYQPSEYSIVYEYKLKFTPGIRPQVFSTQPQIAYNDDIHMYSRDGSLCLFYPKDYSFTHLSYLFNTIIPWIHEWYLYYELYLLKGKWLHPYVGHRRI
jgi:hypothetical protein